MKKFKICSTKELIGLNKSNMKDRFCLNNRDFEIQDKIFNDTNDLYYHITKKLSIILDSKPKPIKNISLIRINDKTDEEDFLAKFILFNTVIDKKFTRNDISNFEKELVKTLHQIPNAFIVTLINEEKYYCRFKIVNSLDSLDKKLFHFIDERLKLLSDNYKYLLSENKKKNLLFLLICNVLDQCGFNDEIDFNNTTFNVISKNKIEFIFKLIKDYNIANNISISVTLDYGCNGLYIYFNANYPDSIEANRIRNNEELLSLNDEILFVWDFINKSFSDKIENDEFNKKVFNLMETIIDGRCTKDFFFDYYMNDFDKKFNTVTSNEYFKTLIINDNIFTMKVGE